MLDIMFCSAVNGFWKKEKYREKFEEKNIMLNLRNSKNGSSTLIANQWDNDRLPYVVCIDFWQYKVEVKKCQDI